MRQATTRLAMTVATALSFVLAATSAHAQSAPADAQATDATESTGLDEILVTARRTKETLISVPVAVTAVNEKALTAANVTSLESAAAIVPFVTIARVGSGNGGFMSIRGIASTPQDAGAQQSVLSNIDYVLIGRGRLATMAMFDISQIEVLKGPQALYYGKNTTAGVFSITSRDPGPDFGGYIKGGYEFEARQRYVDAAVDVPMGDTLKARFAGHYSKMRGFIRNNAIPQPYPNRAPWTPWIAAGVTQSVGASNRWGPNDEEIAGRATFVYEPTSSLTAKLKYTYAQTKNKGSGGTALYLPYCANGQVGVTSNGAFDPQSDCNRDYNTSVGDLPSKFAQNTELLRDGVLYADTHGHLVSLNVDYQASDSIKISSISGYYSVIYQGTGNFSPSTYAGIFTGTRDTASGFSEELRISSDFEAPVNFEFGGYVDSLKQGTFGNAIIIPSAVDPATGRYTTYNRLTDYKSHSYSVFGKTTWEIVDNLKLSGGVRYTKYHLDSTDGNQYVSPTAQAVLAALQRPLILRPQGDYFVRSYNDSNYSPEITLSYQADPSQNLYVSYKTGFKSGGFSYPSVLNTNYTPASTTFQPERATSIEAGYKAELFDRKLRVDLAAYQTTVSNQQLSTFDSTTFSFNVRNAGKSRVKGVELQLTAAPVDGLQIYGNVGYNDGKYLSFPDTQCAQDPAQPCTVRVINGRTVRSQDLSGRVLPRAPKWAGNFGFNYDVPVGTDLKVGFNGVGTFSSSYFSIDSLDKNTIQKSYVKWDAGIALSSADDKWRLALQGRNLSNKFVTLYSYDAANMLPQSYVAVPQRGRQVSLEATYNF